MNEYILGEEAVLDLEDIWDYIALDSPEAADRWIEKLLDNFDVIAQSPAVGHRRDDLTQYPVLFWTVGAYLIIYRFDRGRVEIVAVTQGSRDIPAFLRRRLQ